jgi:hypothetical protein
MTIQAQRAHGTLLGMTGGNIAEVYDIKGPDMTKNTIEIPPTHDSDFAETLPGPPQTGTVTFRVNWLTGHSSNLLALYNSGGIDSFTITPPGGAVWSFNASVGSISPDFPVMGAVCADITLNVTGEVDCT